MGTDVVDFGLYGGDKVVNMNIGCSKDLSLGIYEDSKP